MAKQTINIGASANDGTGTPLRTSFDYCNLNFTELYTAVGPSGNNIVCPGSATITGDLTAARLIVTGGTIPTNGLWLPTTNTLEFAANSLAQYRIAPLGVHSWYDGAGGTRMTLNATGLGIGTSASQRLHIQNSGDVYARIQTTSVAKAGVQFVANGVVRSHVLYDDGAGTTYLTSGTTFGGSGQALAIQSGTSFQVYTNNQLSTVQMTVDASGNLLVGKTANYGTGSGESNYIQVKSGVVYAADNIGSASNRNWTVSPNGSSAGALDWTISSTNNNWPNFAYRMQLTSAGALNNTTGTYGTISDLRLKENISDARNYLADLLKLRVVKYSLKEEASAVATKLGFIAQEVEQVFPNLVEQSDKEYEGAEGIRSVKTSILIPMLLKAIQELTARVQTLETR